jgi:hypothetical protein
LDQFEPRLRILSDEHLHDIEPKKNVRIIKQAQPGESALRNASSFPPVYRRHWPSKILAPARFDLDKNESVAIAADDIDFAAAPAAEIAVENFVTVAAQKTAGEFFATRAAAEMLR